MVESILYEQKDLKGRDFEDNYYNKLSQHLEKKEFKEVEGLIDKSIDLDIFIDPRKIPNRFEIISELLIDCIQTLNLGEIFKILKFVNKFNLVDKDLTKSEIELINDIRKDYLFFANLIDLFGNISNSFIIYVRKEMPLNLLYYYNDYFREYSFQYYSNEVNDIDLILNYLDDYNAYGLNVKLLGNLEDFLKSFQRKVTNENAKFIQIRFANKFHLVSPKNLRKNLEKIVSRKEYKFYSLSMVILYGIGPQGLGFTFSTPRGEVIEICTDVKQNEAMIIKYKQFLTEQFLFKLKEDLVSIKFPDSVIDKLILYLLDLLKSKNQIDYYEKDIIIQKIKDFYDNNLNVSLDKVQKLLPEISKFVAKILRPIKLIDQFKVRMDLIAKNKLKSEDVAKLTSLREKSNYDVLRERFFLQYIIKWFYELYLIENSK
ncbi:MAG: hypothetical protein ACFFEO_03380 [Candidatus Thorarchaeota archaeon]